jgi:hypothetical protein
MVSAGARVARNPAEHARVIAHDSEFHRFRRRPTLAGLDCPH